MTPCVDSPYTLVLSRRSILDTLFLFKAPHDSHGGKPTYATTTDGSTTTLWRISDRGRMSEVSQILWSSAPGQSHQLLINGQVMLAENVLQRSKSLFGSDSRTFIAGTTRFKWKTGRTSAPYRDSAQEYLPAGFVFTDSQMWTCYEYTDPSTAARALPDGSPSPTIPSVPPIVALFFPPQSGCVKSELTIYPKGEVVLDHIVLTAILLCSRKDEWRSSRSLISPRTLEASLRADIRGSLPPYLPAASRFRVRTPTHRRRPHTSGPSRARPTSSHAPPPYTSVDDESLRSRP